MADGEQITGILRSWQDAVRPKSRLTVAEWAAAHRKLPASNQSSGGWDNTRTPYLVDIMNSLSERDPSRVVVVMAGAQVGKSEAGYNTIGYWIDECPANIILALPTEKLYRMVSGSRIQPLIDLTDTIRDKFVSGGTVEYKKFVGGALHMVTAKSAPSLRSMPARYVVADEVDAYPTAIPGEGDPLTLLRRRMATYEWQSKFLITSTPLLKNSSRVAAYMEQTDFRRYHVPCLECGHEQVIEWAQIKWDEGKPETARFLCKACDHAHSESDKTALLAGGKWVATKVAANADWVGYQLSALYSPYGWYSWRQAVEEFIAGKTDEYKRQSWVNTVLGEPFTHYGYRPTLDADNVKPVRYDADAPTEVVVLTAGIDVQKDRVEVYVWGWGDKETPYLVDFQEYHGDLSHEELWREVYDFLNDQRYTSADGRSLRINSACVDTGGLNTQEVYRFVYRANATGYRRLYAIKGSAGYNRDIINKSPTLITGQLQKFDSIALYTVGVDPCKSTLYRKINNGHLHAPIALPNGEVVTAEFWKQLTAEVIKTQYKNGFPNDVWVKDYPRNEALDCWVYAYAALKMLNPNWRILIAKRDKRSKKAI